MLEFIKNPNRSTIIEEGWKQPQTIMFERSTKSIVEHLKPLYINANFDGIPVNKVLIDNGARINILPAFNLLKHGKHS